MSGFKPIPIASKFWEASMKGTVWHRKSYLPVQYTNLFALQRIIYVLIFWELCGLSPNFHIYVSVSDFWLQQRRMTYPGNIYISHRYMSVGIGGCTDYFWEYINGNQTFILVPTGPSFAMGCRCSSACHPFEFQATPLGLVGLGRGVLQAKWDKKPTSSNENFSFGAFIEDHPYHTVTSQVEKFGACVPVHANSLNFKLRRWS
jgi:hypothetical protein